MGDFWNYAMHSPGGRVHYPCLEKAVIWPSLHTPKSKGPKAW